MKIKGIPYKKFSNFIKEGSLSVGDEVWIHKYPRYRKAKVTSVHKDGIYVNHHALKRVKLKWNEDHYQHWDGQDIFEVMNSSERRHLQKAYRADKKLDDAIKSGVTYQHAEW